MKFTLRIEHRGLSYGMQISKRSEDIMFQPIVFTSRDTLRTLITPTSKRVSTKCNNNEYELEYVLDDVSRAGFKASEQSVIINNNHDGYVVLALFALNNASGNLDKKRACKISLCKWPKSV